MIKKLEDIKSLTLYAYGIGGSSKSPVLYGSDDTATVPLIYFRKPKGIKKELFDQLINGLKIAIKTTP